MPLHDIFAPVAGDLRVVRQQLKHQIEQFQRIEPLSGEQYAHVINVTEHFWAAPGKGLRPALVLLTAQLLGSNGSAASSSHAVRQFAAVVELFHSASLVHDDVIDRASSRRNQVSLNERYGDDVALVVGDELILEAFALLFELDAPVARQQQMFQVMCRALRKMCMAGLCEQRLLTTETMADLADYLRLLDQKTATLMSACCECSAILMGCGPDLRQHMADFGTNFGIAFQVADDLKDQDALLQQGIDPLPVLRDYTDKAREALARFPDMPAKNSLLALCGLLAPDGHAPGIFEQACER